jgi:hypothetical protein
LDGDPGTRCGVGDEFGSGLAFIEISHGKHDMRALGCERGRSLVAQAGVGARDDGGPTGLIGNVGGCPLGHRVSSVEC